MGVLTQVNVQAMIGAVESECLSSEVMGYQEYLDLEAMALCVMTAFWTRVLELSSTRYAMYFAKQIIAGMYVGNIPRSALTDRIGVVECSE